jgi:hypothetical protein
MSARGITLGTAMVEMGYRRRNSSLGNAMSNARRIVPNSELLKRVTVWLVMAEKSGAHR